MNLKKSLNSAQRSACVCDLIYGGSYHRCEASSGYLCALQTNAEQVPRFRLNGRTIDFDTAVKTSSRILLDARYPLLTGLQSLGVKSQQLAVDIGTRVNGVIDTCLDHASRGAALSLTREGMVTATLGELAKSSQLLLLIGCDPKQTHPRVFERMTRKAAGVFVAVLDAEGNQSAAAADVYLQVSHSQLEASLMILESILRCTPFNLDRSGFSPIIVNQLKAVAAKMRTMQQIVVVTGDEVNSGAAGFGSCLDSICSWIKWINRDVRAVCLKLRSDQNGVGAENVLTWSTGFPSAVDATRHSPISFAVEHCSDNILDRQESDAVLLFQCNQEPINGLGKFARKHFFSNPAIIVTHADCQDLQLFDQSNSELLEISNLHCLDDDFLRLDELLFSVSSQVRGPCQSLREFLIQLLAITDPRQLDP